MNDTETSAALLKPFPQRPSEQMPSVPLIPLPPHRVLSCYSFPLNSKASRNRKKKRKKTKKIKCLQMENRNVNSYGKVSKYCNIKIYRKFLRNVYCKPQAAFLGCVLTGLAQQDPGPHMLPDFNNTTSGPFLLYFMLQLYDAPGIQSYFKLSHWF